MLVLDKLVLDYGLAIKGDLFGMDRGCLCFSLIREIPGLFHLAGRSAGNQEGFAIFHLGFVLHDAVLWNADAVQLIDLDLVSQNGQVRYLQECRSGRCVQRISHAAIQWKTGPCWRLE
jgi:hypothetical protein